MRNETEARTKLLYGGVLLAALFLFTGSAQAVTVVTDMEGQLVKGSKAEVYFVGTDNKRYVFPNEKVFYSWYEDFSSVKILTDDEVNSLPIGGNVTYKPNSRLVKIPNDPKVYAVSSAGQLRWIQNEEVAKRIFGDNWAKRVDDVPDSMFANYQQGQTISSVDDYESASDDKGEAEAVIEVFKIESVELAFADGKDQEAEDLRSFKIVFNQNYTGGRLTIAEKTAGTIIYSEPLPLPAAQVSQPKVADVAPEGWKAKLKPNTSYAWKVVAYAAPNARPDQTATASGEFITADFEVAGKTADENETGTKTEIPVPSGTGDTDGKTATPADSDFKITSVTLSRKDAEGKEAEDVRTFSLAFSAAAKNVRIIIAEKNSGSEVLSLPVSGGAEVGKSVVAPPSDWNMKLKPNTAYAWKVVAYAATGRVGNPYPYDVVNGEFTTSEFEQDDGSAEASSAAVTVKFCSTGDGATQGCCAAVGASFAIGSLPLPAGTLIRGTSSPMVYYYASDGKRYVMTGQDVMVSWYESGDNLINGTSGVCRNVRQLTDSGLATIPVGGNVGLRPGTYVIKIASDPKLYVIARNRTIRALASNDLAEKIFPGSSALRLRTVPDVFFSGYKAGPAVTSVSDYDPSAEYDWGKPNTLERELGAMK